MSSAAARAEARRKAILARGTDRLAKLTTSARGEDAPAYVRDDKPLEPRRASNVAQFVGEESILPTPPPISRTTSDSYTSSSTTAASDTGGLDPNTWSQDQQQLLSALLGAAAGGAGNPVDADMQEQQRRLFAAMLGGMGGMGGAGALPPPQQQRRASSVPPQQPMPDDPLSALLAMSNQEGGEMPPMPDFLKNMAPPPSVAPKPKTLLEKLLPVVHLAAAWILLAYFIFWKEPEAYESRTYGAVQPENRWTRWADLARRRPEEGWGVQFVPFFWAFTTLTLVLHTWRIFRGLDPVRPPAVISLALMHIPAPFPSLILNFLKYLQIGSVFFDDIAVLLFGVGLLVWVATWLA